MNPVMSAVGLIGVVGSTDFGIFFSEPPLEIPPISVAPAITTDAVTIYGAYASTDPNGLMHFTLGVPMPTRGVLFWPITYLPVFAGGRGLGSRTFIFETIGLSNYITSFEKTGVDEVAVHFVGTVAQYPGGSGWTATDCIGTQTAPVVLQLDGVTLQLTFGRAFVGSAFVRCTQPFDFVFSDLRPLIGPTISLALT